MYLTGDNRHQDLLVFAPNVSFTNIGKQLKTTNWMSTGVSHE